MRSILLMLVLILGSLVLGWSYAFEDLENFSDLTEVLQIEKEIRINGLQGLSEDYATSLLPQEWSVIWWLLFPNRVTEKLRDSPFLSKIDFRRCNFWSVSCFQITLLEREPGFISSVAGRLWLFDKDGMMLLPVDAQWEGKEDRDYLALVKLVGSSNVSLPIVKGLNQKDVMPQITLARGRYAAQALELLEEHTDFDVKEILINPNGELKVYFEALSFPVTFDYAPTLNGAGSEQLLEELVRLKEVLKEFRGREAFVESIDLAFNKIAVVRLVKKL